MDKDRRIIELETEIAYLKKTLDELQEKEFSFDKYNDSRYWRERCVKAESRLDVLRLGK